MVSNSSTPSMPSGRSSDDALPSAADNNNPHPAGRRRIRRTGSNISSTSSDILVAPGPNANNDRSELMRDSVKPAPTPERRVWIENGHMLKIRLSPNQLRGVEARSSSTPHRSQQRHSANNLSFANLDGANDSENPNSRGTYSKEYVQRHPEIQWVHRGQGRYLPAKEIRKDPVSTPSHSSSIQHSRFAPELPPNHNTSNNPQHNTINNTSFSLSLPTTDTHPLPSPIAVPPAEGVAPRRKRRAIEEQLQDSLSPIPVYGLRRQRTRGEPQSPDSATENRPARLSRRVSTFSNSRKFYGSQTPTEYSEAEDDDASADMADNGSDNKETFTKDYVDAHPDEDFHHTGNGWYRRGKPPNKRRKSKPREVDDNVWLEADGTWAFDPNKTVHSTQVDKFPGYEFHHTGNGWYRAGPMRTQQRTSIVIPNPSATPSFSETVSKEYTLQHPEIEWTHRGGGRYVRKESTQPPTFSADPNSLGVDFGAANGRAKRTPRPSARASQSLEDDAVDIYGAGMLFSKEYVDANPHLTFHHRGQGRYALGERPPPPAPRSINNSFNADAEPESEAGLVDTAYVDAHPEETFHHKGQGRWARGLPPPGTSNKIAIRGPDAPQRADGDGDAEPDIPGLPIRTALVKKSEGPDKFPESVYGIQWHYRGGGKWGRMTKQEYDSMNSSIRHYDVGNSSRHRPRNRQSGPQRSGAGAQLQRETDAAGSDFGGAEDDDDLARFLLDPRRRRRNNVATDLANGHHSSRTQSDAPTPRPPMMPPEDDILGPEDLPPVFLDEHSPLDSEDDSEATQLYRSAYLPLNIEAAIKSLTKYDVRSRPTENLMALAEHFQQYAEILQDEYIENDKIVAPHSRIPRKPAKGGRQTVEHQVFEDKKEADLLDYTFDQRKIGFQDPVSQAIIRDSDGRELRKRRGRHALDANNGIVPGWEFTELGGAPAKRQSRQPTRFDGTAAPQSTRRRANNQTQDTEAATPDGIGTPVSNSAMTSFHPPTSGRWANHVPKRVSQLRREESVVTVRSEGGSETKVTRKGRPPGAKNHAVRKDKGIKKGPRKAKTGNDGSPTPDTQSLPDGNPVVEEGHVTSNANHHQQQLLNPLPQHHMPVQHIQQQAPYLMPPFQSYQERLQQPHGMGYQHHMGAFNNQPQHHMLPPPSQPLPQPLTHPPGPLNLS